VLLRFSKSRKRTVSDGFVKKSADSDSVSDSRRRHYKLIYTGRRAQRLSTGGRQMRRRCTMTLIGYKNTVTLTFLSHSVSRSKSRLPIYQNCKSETHVLWQHVANVISLSMVIVHIGTLHIVKICTIFVAICSKVSNYKSNFYISSS